MSSVGEVLLEVRDAIATVTLAAPDVRNALSPAMARTLSQVCDEIDADDSVGAAVLVGAGGVFCAGADTRYWEPDADQCDDETFQQNGSIYAALLRVGRLRVPTVAAVRGCAVGAGLNLMLAADVRVVSSDARLLGGFGRAGIHPGGGFFTLAGRAAGREFAAAVGLFGEELSGAEAGAAGLAWSTVPDPQVESEALRLASLASADPALSREAVRSFRCELGPPPISWEAAVEFERATQMWSMQRRNQRRAAAAAGGAAGACDSISMSKPVG